jgi:dipeptidyl-peptidase-4
MYSGIIVNPLAAQEKKELTVEWIYSKRGQAVDDVPKVLWLKDNTAILYDVRKPESERTFERFDPKYGKRFPLVDPVIARASLNKVTGEDTAKVLHWPEAFDRQGKHAVYIMEKDIFLLDLAASKFTRVTQTDPEEKSTRFSPDGSKLAFVRDNNLFVYDISSQSEKQLTQDGSETLLNGTLSWVYWEEIFARRDIGYWWSEDSKSIAYLQTDESPAHVYYFMDFKPDTARVIKQRYPQAGGKNPVVRVGIVDIANPQPRWLDFSSAPYEYVIRVKWLPDNKRISVQTMNREQTQLDLYFADAATGEPTHVLTETDTGWVNTNDDLYFLKDGKHFIWQSERDGYAHLYRFAMDGELVNKITKGNWAVRASGGGVFWLRRAVTAIDEENDWIYFTALKESSIERHLYRVHLDGSGLQKITKEAGYHGITASPDGSYYFDTYSNINTMPSLSLYNKEGELKQILAKPRPELLADFDMTYPELFSIEASDGFEMPAELLKPKNFDPNKKYPLIIYVYGGPAAPTVFNRWRNSIYFDNILSQHGYLVALCDNRAATARSKILENLLLYKSADGVELSDLLNAVGWFKSQPYVDSTRVGVWGWSGGGSFTLNALTNSKAFKAGISVAPVTDWHYYDTKWAEATMKRPSENPEGYEKTSFLRTAKNLHGRLLLAFGTYDDNVHPQNEWAFIDELVKHNIAFDLMVYPMRKHSIKDWPARIHLYSTMLDFWQGNL